MRWQPPTPTQPSPWRTRSRRITRGWRGWRSCGR
jgi:hypothetical protein